LIRIKETQAAIAVQKIECCRWDNLHELIGSADGKKYRNFAQSLTFEMLVGHAKQQLQKMTDRYLRARDYTQPLELRRGVVSDSRYNFHLSPLCIIELKEDRVSVPQSSGTADSPTRNLFTVGYYKKKCGAKAPQIRCINLCS
jgi:hypothetical protein